MVSPDKVRKLFRLDSDSPSGVVWINGHRKGKDAGYFDETVNYFIVRHKRTTMRAHRIIALLDGKLTDELWSDVSNFVVDHKDGDTRNNRPDNLRVVSLRENAQNTVMHRAGKSVGTTFCKTRGAWRSRITVNGKVKHLGWFSSEEEASTAYNKYLKELHE